MAALTGMPAAATTAAAAAASFVTISCNTGNNFDDSNLSVRVSAIFVIWIGSLFGACFPIFARRTRTNLMPDWAFFIAKYFGSGVIVATAFIHLLAPANNALTNPCLTGVITQYSWAEGIALMTIFVLFFIELLVMRTGAFQSEPKHDEDDGGDAYGRSPDDVISVGGSYPGKNGVPMRERTASTVSAPARGEDHLGHSRHHTDSEEIKADAERLRNHNPAHGQPHSHGDGHGHGGHGGGIEALTGGSAHSHGVEDYAAQMTAIFVLEFGIIFHSIFIGLTLAVTSAADFNVLYVVLVFHQTFEGLGLGTRLAITPWGRGRRRRWTPYVLALAYSFSTPVATAVGLGLRTTYAPGGQTARVVNGVFDSISAGILIYTGLVELMAHEFMFSETMRRSSFRVMVSAFGVMCAGAGLMALLGKWA